MAKRLKNLQIQEVSSVDRGAGRGVQIMLMKRDVPIRKDWTKWNEDHKNDSQSQHAANADRHTAQASKAKEEGRNADAAAHSIIAGWHQDAYVAGVKANGPEGARSLKKADSDPLILVKALELTIKSIIDDPDVADKNAAMDECFKQLQDHIDATENDTMPTLKELAKALEAGVAEAVTKMSADDKAVYTKLEGEVAKSFALMDDAERAAYIAKAFPPKKKPAPADDNEPDADDEAKKRAAVELAKRDAEIAKRDEAIAKRDQQIADMKKNLDVLVEKDQKVEFAKRATDLGLAEADGEMLRKAHLGDPEALKKMEDTIKALAAQRNTGDVFKEFGSRGSQTGATAHDQLVAKAAEIRKTEPKLTVEQAYEKAMLDPSNKEIVALEKIERDRKIFRVAS